MRQNDAIDLTKLILALIVVQIHVFGPLQLSIVSKIAVPLFFMISSYFFFGKWDSRPKPDWSILKKFESRLVKLYLFWFVLLLPVTVCCVFYTDFHERGIVYGCVKIAAKVFLGATFPASWYLSALGVGVPLLCLLPKKAGWILGIPTYLVCVLASNYRNCFPVEGWFQQLFVYAYPGTFYLSFPGGLLWIHLGRWLTSAQSLQKISTPRLVVFAAVSCVLVTAEKLVVRHYGLSVDDNSYFLLVPLCIALFLLILRWNFRFHSEAAGPLCRKISIVMYCFHASFLIPVKAGYFGSFFTTWTYPAVGAAFLLNVAVCVALALLLIRLQKCRGMNWIKYAW